MANGYPPFIFADAIPAQQMMAHQQAMNEGLRIQELGKARQAESLFRMAQLGQQAKQAQETNELNRMIAQSKLMQDQITNSFRDRQLTQEGQLARERNENYLTGLRIQYPEGRVSAQERIFDEKLKLEEEDRKRAETEELRLITEAESALSNLNKQEARLREMIGMGTSGSSSLDLNLPVLQSKLGQINLQKQTILQGLAKKGYDYDPTSQRFMGVNRPVSAAPVMGTALRQTEVPGFQGLPAPQLNQPPAPMSLGMEEARLTPFDMRLRGVNPGDVIQQGGQRYRVAGPTSPLPSSALQSEVTHPMQNFYAPRQMGLMPTQTLSLMEGDPNVSVPGGFNMTPEMRAVASNPNLPIKEKERQLIALIYRTYPQYAEALQRIYALTPGY